MQAVAKPRSNALLSEVPQKERARLARLLKPVSLTFGEVLQEAQLIKHVYFPVDCLVSLFAPLRDNVAVEVGLVGSEGMVGVPLALGVSTSSVRAVVQGSGSALKMGAAAFQRELDLNPVLTTSIHRYIHLLMCQVTQTAACNAYHSIEARCARWLLMTSDRMRSDKVELTHEYLARMLGVRRVGVTVAAGNLQRQGVIAYSRGHITILEPKKLEKIACECYGLVKARYENPDG
ncbi:MAG TPA: Crp/Fnr family transcriptional regulator [Burkholderiales bacterium]|nr:Crp/Fnr family transcriptional regulator [Burkholderiales bacterium]